MSAVESLNTASEEEARALLLRCCGAARWAERMTARRPFADHAELLRAADEVWAQMERDDILEALAAHPEIGTDMDALRAKYASTASWSEQEQRSVAAANEETLTALRDGNVAYRKRFGHIFVVCATGKSAEEMLVLLHARLPNDPARELEIAAAEQAKITRIRLEKL